MIETKTIEMRDRATMIPMLAIRVWSGFRSEEKLSKDNWLLRRAGWGENLGVYLMRLDLVRATVCNDGYGWTGSVTEQRTYRAIHDHMQRNWDSFESGDVLDVEYLLSETDEPKKSERGECND
jgi:hypothetical protein